MRLDISVLAILGSKLRRRELHELAISHYDTLETLRGLACMFPALTTLNIVRFGTSDRYGAHSQYTMVSAPFFTRERSHLLISSVGGIRRRAFAFPVIGVPT